MPSNNVCMCYRHKCERKLAVVRLIKPYQCRFDSVAADSDTDSDDTDSADADDSADETSELLSASNSAHERSAAPASKDRYCCCCHCYHYCY